MHGRAAEERITADSESGREFHFADHGLSIRHERQRAVETIDLGAGHVDPIQLAFEGAGVGAKLYRNVGPAHRRAWRRGFQLADVETEVADDAAHAPHP